MQKKKRVMGIEPTYPAWKAGVLPLNYTRKKSILFSFINQCPEQESNQRHRDFQSLALPTELSGHFYNRTIWILPYLFSKVKRNFKFFYKIHLFQLLFTLQMFI